MTSQEAKEILLLYRPGVDQDDPEFAEALQQAGKDPALKAWLDQQCITQSAVSRAFEQIPVPEGLKEQILSERKAHLSATTRRKALVLASIPLVLALVWLASYFTSPKAADFSTYRLRMAGKVLRDYPKMDLETADLKQIRQYLAQHGGSKDYVLPTGLEKTSGTGCAIFEWQGKKDSILCFN